jgi:hypothetical protein
VTPRRRRIVEDDSASIRSSGVRQASESERESQAVVLESTVVDCGTQLVDRSHVRSTQAAGFRNCRFLVVVEDRATCAGTRAAHARGIMKTKKTLKLSLETIRRLDLGAAQGGYYHRDPMYSRGDSCGIGCSYDVAGCGHTQPLKTVASCGYYICKPQQQTMASCGVDMCL